LEITYTRKPTFSDTFRNWEVFPGHILLFHPASCCPPQMTFVRNTRTSTYVLSCICFTLRHGSAGFRCGIYFPFTLDMI
jgi:hypothetical protein